MGDFKRALELMEIIADGPASKPEVHEAVAELSTFSAKDTEPTSLEEIDRFVAVVERVRVGINNAEAFTQEHDPNWGS